MKNNAAIIIPSRYGSHRFPGKPLAQILGHPMIYWVWRRCKRSRACSTVIIATDDKRIQEAAEAFGACVVMTSKKHENGTERIAEVVRGMKAPPQIVINVQGDEPFIDSNVVDDMIRKMEKDRRINMMTLIKPITDDADLKNPNVVKVVENFCGNAIYFSRHPIPYCRDTDTDKNQFYKSIGGYAYRKEFLFTFIRMKKGRLEQAEKLEQLRVLENGYPLRVLKTNLDSLSVDTKEDLIFARRYAKIHHLTP